MKRQRESESDTSPPEGASAKITELDPLAIIPDCDQVAMSCCFPPHKEALSFTSYAAYETHYMKCHTNRCLECAKNFPSPHFLSLHIEEFHDPIVAIKRDQGDHTFSCFVEDCVRKCRTPQKRRMHLIDKHMYPKNYFFAITKAGIDGRRSLLLDNRQQQQGPSTDIKQPKQDSAAEDSTTAATTPPEPSTQPQPVDIVTDQDQRPTESTNTSQQPRELPVEESDQAQLGGQPDAEMADLTEAVSALRFVPTSVRFGRGRGRRGFSRS